MKDPERVKRGKKNRASGATFELRVRSDLESKGWIVDKWSNNVEFNFNCHKDCPEFVPEGIYLDEKEKMVTMKKGRLIPTKNKFRGKGIPMMLGGGFPDFLAYKRAEGLSGAIGNYCEVIGIEVKTNGYLTKEEREKCQWYLDNNIFSKILVASKYKIKNRIHIEYKEFKNA